jgi:hypothetical protein
MEKEKLVINLNNHQSTSLRGTACPAIAGKQSQAIKKLNGCLDKLQCKMNEIALLALAMTVPIDRHCEEQSSLKQLKN